jgi:hypothetical protein
VYDLRLKSSGAAASTANQDRTSVSRSLTGCHWRSEMNGATVPSASICGQLCTKLRFGNRVAAEGMNPLSATSARCRSDQAAAMAGIIASG